MTLDFLSASTRYEKRFCVYLLMRGDAVVYVGKSEALEARIQVHRCSDKVFDVVRYFEATESEMGILEEALIRYLEPEYNRQSFGPLTFAHREILRRYEVMGDPPTGPPTRLPELSPGSSKRTMMVRWMEFRLRCVFAGVNPCSTDFHRFYLANTEPEDSPLRAKLLSTPPTYLAA